MPKVTSEYMKNKRRQIVDAAYQVCLRKPAEMVTISDVIAETGMSQGAIYRYYAGLDEIFMDMISNMRREYSIIGRMEEIIADKSLTFEETTYKICDCLADVMEEHLMDIQKINFDFGVLAINEPDRAAKIMSGLDAPGNMDYLAARIFPKLMEGADILGYKPQAEPADIMFYITAAYTGIEKYCILSACYGSGNPNAKADPRKLFRTYAKTIILLTGGKTDE